MIARTVDEKVIPQGVAGRPPATVAVALRDAAMVIATLTPLGLAVGAAIGEMRVSGLTGWLSAPLVYGASGQLAAVSMLAAGGGWLSIIGTVAIINSRAVFLSAALRPAFRTQPRWFRCIAPYLLVEPMFALVSARRTDLIDPADLRRYYLVAGCVLWAAWLLLVALGIALGPDAPSGAALRFALPALLLGMLVPSVHGAPALAAALVAVTISIVAAPFGSLSLLVAALGGAAAGSSIEIWRSQ